MAPLKLLVCCGCCPCNRMCEIKHVKSQKLRSKIRSPRKTFGGRWTLRRNEKSVFIFGSCQIMRVTEGIRIQKIGNKEQGDSNNESFLESFLMVGSCYLCSRVSNVLFQPLQGRSLVSCVWVLSTPVVIQGRLFHKYRNRTIWCLPVSLGAPWLWT